MLGLQRVAERTTAKLMSVSPAERPAAPRARLSRERVLTAALALLDEKGLDQLTMRRLAHQLGRDPMALYRYLPNRAALLDGVVELFLAQLSAPIQDLDWQAQLRSSAHDYRRLALSHPHVVPLLVTRPLSHPLGPQPPGVLRPVEQMLTRLIGAGFAPVTALHVHRAYTGCLKPRHPARRPGRPTRHPVRHRRQLRRPAPRSCHPGLPRRLVGRRRDPRSSGGGSRPW